MRDPSVSVIVTTFESPAMLRRVLLGLVRQTVLPLEVLAADDGSGPETAALLVRLASDLPFPLVHVWQPHADFRAARSRNNAAFRARGRILAFLDQDTVPHADWLEAHLAGLKPGRLSLGDMLPLDEAAAARLDEAAIRSGAFETAASAAAFRRLAALQRKQTLYAGLRRLGVGVKAKPRLRSCNFAIPAETFGSVNGFDETYVGWGQEDDDLGRRLYRQGVSPVIRIARARVSHWPHPPRRPADWTAGANARRYRAGAGGPAFCAAGLSAHPHADVRVTALGAETASASGSSAANASFSRLSG